MIVTVKFRAGIAIGICALAVQGCGGGGTAPQTSITPQPGTITLAASSAMVQQSTGSATVTVNRVGGFDGVVTAAYATTNGSAVAGTDFTTTSGTLMWSNADASSRTIPIPLATTVFYGTRSFVLSLSSSTGGAILGTSSETITITGSASAPLSPGTLGLTANTATVAQTAGTLSIPVTRSSGSTGSVSLAYATTDGTATTGNEYTTTSGTLTWADGDIAAKNITIPISNAHPYNGTHTFNLALSSPTGGATLGSISNATVNVTGSWIAPSTYPQFDLSKWKLTLPIDQYGGTGGTNGSQYEAQQILPAQLQAGFVDAYFYADTTGNIVFTLPSNGATTTPGSGSNHTRSELRELYTSTGHDSNDDWNSNIGGTLTATCVVNSVSVDTDQATIGQIHGQDYVFTLITYHPAQKSVVITVWTTNTSTSGYTNTTLLTGVNLGDTLSYSIHYLGSTITTTVRDVTTNSTTQTLNSAIDSSWSGTPVYFKAGAYHGASNTGNPTGDQTQVSFSAFAINH